MLQTKKGKAKKSKFGRIDSREECFWIFISGLCIWAERIGGKVAFKMIDYLWGFRIQIILQQKVLPYYSVDAVKNLISKSKIK